MRTNIYKHTANKIAHILGAVIGRPDLKWVTFTDEQAQSGLGGRGIPAHIAANFVEPGACTHSGVLRQDFDLHKPVTIFSSQAFQLRNSSYFENVSKAAFRFLFVSVVIYFFNLASF